MVTTIFAGKGGVGKTTSACAYSVALQRNGAGSYVIDYDGGHSVAPTLGATVGHDTFTHCAAFPGIFVGQVDPLVFTSISQYEKPRARFSEYISQFKDAQGIVAFADMLSCFFGAPTDCENSSKFADLAGKYKLASATDTPIIIDVEPTAGLERLVVGADAIGRSLIRLSNKGIVNLTLLGAKWPEIRAFLKSDYIQEAQRHADDMRYLSSGLKDARYILVTIPEQNPVSQLETVRSLVEKFGARVHGYVVNNIRGDQGEAVQIERVKQMAGKLPVVMINRDPRMVGDVRTHEEKRDALADAGKLIQDAID